MPSHDIDADIRTTKKRENLPTPSTISIVGGVFNPHNPEIFPSIYTTKWSTNFAICGKEMCVVSKTLEDIDDQQKKDLNRTKVDAVVFNKKQQLKNHLGYFLHPIETDALGEILSPYIPLTTTA